MAKRDPVATGVLVALIVIGIVLLLWFMTRISSIVVIVLIATVLAAGIAPIVERITRAKLPPRGWSLPRSAAVILVYVALIIVVGLIGTVIGSVVVKEAVQLARSTPGYLAMASDWLTGLQHKYHFLPQTSGIMDKLREQFGTISSYAYQATGRLIGFLGNILVLIVTFVIAFYLLTAEHSAKQGFLNLIPPSRCPIYDATFTEMGGWLRGQVTLALIIGIVGAVAELVAMLGPSVAAIPAVLLVLFEAKWQAIVVIIFFVILSQVESNILFPKVMKQAIGLNPVITILALLAGATVAGFIGALLAIPLTAAVQVFYQRIILPAIEAAEEGR